MTVTLQLSPEQEAALKAQADVHGMSVEEWLLQIADQHAKAHPASLAHLQKSDPKEWARRFHEWAEGHDRSTPLLSDDAISRESIYPDGI